MTNKPATKPSCFVIMPITTSPEAADAYSDDDHFGHVLECLFLPAIEMADMEPIPPLAEGSDLIHARIVKQLEDADLVLCDMSAVNPNVFFELGIRTALDRPISLVKDDLTKTVPFDTGIINYHEYMSDLRPWQLTEQIEQLALHLTKSAKESDPHNPIWRYFGISARVNPLSEGITDKDTMAYIVSQLDAIRSGLGNADVAKARELVGPELQNIGEAIRYRRRELGLSLQQLTEQSGISKATISRIENGIKTPTRGSVHALVQALDALENDILEDGAP